MKMLLVHVNALKSLINAVIEKHYLDEATVTVADWLNIKEFEYRTSGHGPNQKLKDVLHFAYKKDNTAFALWYQGVDQYCDQEHVLTAMRKVWAELSEPEENSASLGYFVDWNGIVRSANQPGDGYKCQRAGAFFEIIKGGEVIHQAQPWKTLADLEAEGIKVVLHKSLKTSY